tara:strand:+ start:17010 stop:17252 length:243 start_codon:yes stop_codon:yes gene_type:complete
MIINLPQELILSIRDFLFVECEECNKIYTLNEVEKDITMTYYKAIFDDDYPFPRIYKSFKYLCKKCIIDFKEKLIAPLKY